MLRDTAISIIARRLGKRTDLDDQILDEMQLVQEVMEHADMLPFFLLTELATASTEVGEERVKIPTDFLKEYEAGALWYYDSTDDQIWFPLKRREIEELKGAFTDDGPPQYYALAGEYYRIAPVPDDVYTLKMLYYGQDALLTSNIENQWLKYAPELMIAETGLRVAAYIQNDKLVAIFQQNQQMAYEKFWRYCEARKHSNQDYRMEFS